MRLKLRKLGMNTAILICLRVCTFVPTIITGLMLWRPMSSGRQLSSLPRSARFHPSFEEIAAASPKLCWEKWNDQKAAPILDLSSRDGPTVAVVQQIRTTDSGKNEDAAAKEEEWFGGSVWLETLAGLIELGVLKEGEDDDAYRNFLARAPQLLRLPTAVVLEAAGFVAGSEGLSSPKPLLAEPALLTWPADELVYALKFLAIMMATSEPAVRFACIANPALLVAGVEGSFQERAVSDAFGSAAKATFQVKQAIVSDAMRKINPREL